MRIFSHFCVELHPARSLLSFPIMVTGMRNSRLRLRMQPQTRWPDIAAHRPDASNDDGVPRPRRKKVGPRVNPLIRPGRFQRQVRPAIETANIGRKLKTVRIGIQVSSVLTERPSVRF